jgi:hypothetical protein
MIIERQPTQEEITVLKQAILQQESLRSHILDSLRIAMGVLILIFFVSLIVSLILSFLSIAITGHKLIYYIRDYLPPTNLFILSIIAFYCVLWSFVLYKLSSMRDKKRVTNINSKINLDLKNNIVQEENFNITDILCFEEIEHGGLAYFLKTDENKVLFIMDYTSPCDEERTLEQKQKDFFPAKQFKLVKAPMSEVILSVTFSGERFVTSDIYSFGDIDQIPEHGTYVNCDWEDIIQKRKK